MIKLFNRPITIVIKEEFLITRPRLDQEMDYSNYADTAPSTHQNVEVFDVHRIQVEPIYQPSWV